MQQQPFLPLLQRCQSPAQPCCSLLRQWNILVSSWKNSFCMAIWAASLRLWVALIEAMDHVQKPMLRSQRGWCKKTLAQFCSPILHKNPRMIWSTCLGRFLKGPYLWHSRRIHCLQHLWRFRKHQMATDGSPVYSLGHFKLLLHRNNSNLGSWAGFPVFSPLTSAGVSGCCSKDRRVMIVSWWITWMVNINTESPYVLLSLPSAAVNTSW